MVTESPRTPPTSSSIGRDVHLLDTLRGGKRPFESAGLQIEVDGQQQIINNFRVLGVLAVELRSSDRHRQSPE